jgi:hypothetical protein
MPEARYGEHACPWCGAALAKRNMYAGEHEPGCKSMVGNQQDLGRAVRDLKRTLRAEVERGPAWLLRWFSRK